MRNHFRETGMSEGERELMERLCSAALAGEPLAPPSSEDEFLEAFWARVDSEPAAVVPLPVPQATRRRRGLQALALMAASLLLALGIWRAMGPADRPGPAQPPVVALGSDDAQPSPVASPSPTAVTGAVSSLEDALYAQLQGLSESDLELLDALVAGDDSDPLLGDADLEREEALQVEPQQLLRMLRQTADPAGGQS